MSDSKYTRMIRWQEELRQRLARFERLEGRDTAASELEAEAADWRAAADHMEAVEAALRDSTDMLRDLYGQRFTIDELKAQIAANEAALGANHDSN